MKHPNIIAAIFDMDGLLLETERMALTCWHDAARQLGHDIHESIPLGMVGMHSSKTQAYLIERLGVDFPTQRLRELTHEIYLERSADSIDLRPGVLELFDFLEANGVRKAIATSTRRSIAEHHLKMAGLWSRVEFAVCGDEITHPKPAPDIYLKAITQLGVLPEECVVFEDSNFGAQAGHAAGCRVIMVPDLRPAEESVRQLELEIVDSLHQAKDILAAECI
ncbi:HAD family phosphatase [Chitinibacter bivalviorum]|uniref:HAD family phosphatase n=1 Tax=Chitinibacter bivalviorum TaxID=2739434 RepID=A0A7H9BF82_9NEIS|nr:HAD family phosphatase [Chitinibacter bivalviorum]QLG87225.1 HAD family phosphatase [Chitinibacter bivalviorum]